MGRLLPIGLLGLLFAAVPLSAQTAGMHIHLHSRAPMRASSPVNLIATLAFAPDSRTLATGGTDGQVRFWDTRTGRLLRQWPMGQVQVRSLVFSPDGRRLAVESASRNAPILASAGQVQVWHLRPRRLLWTHPDTGFSEGIAFSPSGRRLAISADVPYHSHYATRSHSLPHSATGGGVEEWDLTTHRLVRIFRPVNAPWLATQRDFYPAGGVCGLQFSPDGKMLVGMAFYFCEGGYNYLQAWNTATGRLINFPGMPRVAPSDGEFEVYDERELFTDSMNLGFSRDGGRFFDNDGTYIRLWNGRTGRRLNVVGAHSAASELLYVNSLLCISPHGRRLAVAGYSSLVPSPSSHPLVEVRDAARWHIIQRFSSHAAAPSGPSALAFSPNGKLLACGSADGWLEIWPV